MDQKGPMTRDGDRLDQAARAAWLSWVAGMTQDEIARELGVSRQTAQRLVAQAMAAGIVKVRIDHPLAECLDLGAALKDRCGMQLAEVRRRRALRPGSRCSWRRCWKRCWRDRSR